MEPQHDYQPVSSDPNASAANAPEFIETPPIDPAYVQQVEARAAAAERAAQEAQQRATQLAVAQANAEYEAKKRRALEEAQDDPQKIAQFYEQERTQERAQIQQAMAGALVNSYKGDLKNRYGLRDDQMVLLGEDPNMMDTRAQMLNQQNQQYQQFQQTVDQAFLGQQAHERVMMNSDRIGGARGGAGRPEPTYEKGSMDHLRDLMYGEGQVLVP